MDDERVSGGCFFQLTFKDAIAQKIISDYRILTITVSDERVKEIIRQNRFSTLDLKMRRRRKRSGGCWYRPQTRVQGYGTSHAISFHRSIRSADRFREQQDRLNNLTESGPATTNLHISSKRQRGNGPSW
jgi:predicted helicase